MEKDNDPISGELDRMLQDFKDSEFLPKVAETQLEVADIKPKIVQAKEEDIEQRVVGTEKEKLPKNMSYTWSVEVDGTRFEYVGEIEGIHLFANSVMGKYVLTKYEVDEKKKKILGIIPLGSARKKVWSFESDGTPTKIIARTEGLYNESKYLNIDYYFTCRGGLYSKAMSSGMKLTQNLIDEVFLPMELEINRIYRQSRA